MYFVLIMCWLYISSNVIQKQSDKPLPVVPSLLISWLWFHVTTHYHSISTLSTVYIQTIVGRPPAENWVIISCHNCLLSPQYTNYAGAGFLFLALHDALAPGLDAALSTECLRCSMGRVIAPWSIDGAILIRSARRDQFTLSQSSEKWIRKLD